MRCCANGGYCFSSQQCCLNGCAPINAQCCSDGGYCPSPYICVKFQSSGTIGCCTDLSCKVYLVGGQTYTSSVAPATTARPATTAQTVTNTIQQTTTIQVATTLPPVQVQYTTYTTIIYWYVHHLRHFVCLLSKVLLVLLLLNLLCSSDGDNPDPHHNYTNNNDHVCRNWLRSSTALLRIRVSNTAYASQRAS